MAAAKPRKPGGGSGPKHGESIPKGDALLPCVSTEDLRKMHAELSGRKNAGREKFILAAAIKWREGPGVGEVAGHLLSAPLHGP